MLGSRFEKIGMLYISLLTRPFLDLVSMAGTITFLYTVLSLFINIYWTFFFYMFPDAGFIGVLVGISFFIMAIWSLMSMAITMIESLSDSIEDVIHGGLFNKLNHGENPVNRIEGQMSGSNISSLPQGAAGAGKGIGASIGSSVAGKFKGKTNTGSVNISDK